MKAVRTTPRLAKRLPSSATKTKMARELTLASLKNIKANEINGDSVNEDVFCDNVPLSSTMCKASTDSVVVADVANFDNNNKTAFKFLTQEMSLKSDKVPFGESKILEIDTSTPQSPKRKLRRSISISELNWKCMDQRAPRTNLVFKSTQPRSTNRKRLRRSKSFTDNRTGVTEHVKLDYQPIEPSTR